MASFACLIYFFMASMHFTSGKQTCLQETNQARVNNGKGTYAWDDKLGKAAKDHNDRMIKTNCFSHQCSGESTFTDRLSEAGYSFSSAGENIAAGQANCTDVINAWLNSQAHRNNLLGSYVNVGCAFGSCKNCTYPTYFTCDYGTPLVISD